MKYNYCKKDSHDPRKNTRVFVFSILLCTMIVMIFPFSSSAVYGSDNGDDKQLSLSDFLSDRNISNNDVDSNRFVILTFDDGFESQHTNAKTILDKHGFKASFSIICDYVGDQGYMNWDEIKELEEEGHDIGSHTMTHRSLTEIPIEEAEFEIAQSKQCLLDNDIEDVNYFSYPRNYGSKNKSIVEIVSQYYDLARTATDHLMYLQCDGFAKSRQTDCRTYIEMGDLTFVNRYSIMGWSHDADRINERLDDPEMLDRFTEVMDKALYYNNNKGAVDAIPLLVYHRIDNSGIDYSTTTDLFEAEMEYLHDNGFTVLNMEDIGYDESTNHLYIKEISH